MARSKKRGFLRRLLLRSVGLVLVAVVAFGLWQWLTWPDVAALAGQSPKSTAFVDAAVARGEDVSWQLVPYSEISPEIKRAVVASEDMSFFSHNGFDTHELQIAAKDAFAGRRVRGASTITQQLAKNLWLTPSRSPLRKLREAVLTWQLERHLSKQRILELYLNVAQFGPTIYGVEAASRHYFGVPSADLTAQQAAALAASLPRPSTWHPGVETRGYLNAVERVHTRAAQSDWIDKLL